VKSLLAISLIACGLSTLGASRTLLILEDQTATALAGPIYRQWIHQIASEGWAVKTVPIARWDRNWASNHWVALNRMSNAVVWAQPDAVQVFGSLPYLQTGIHAADGHEQRRCWTDAWLGCTNLVFSDTTAFYTEGTVQGVPSVIATNAPGDGFPDQIGGAFHIPVSRIDAAGMSNVAGAGTFTSGFLAGTSRLPAIDEGLWLRRYLTSNIAYRRREFTFAELGRIESAWLNPSTITATNSSVTWTTGATASSFAGLTNRWSYVGTEWGQASPNYITAGGVATFSFGHVTYKSYHMELADGSGYVQRVLFPGWWDRPLALVAAWGYGAFGGNPYWAGTAADETVGDFIRSSVVQASGGGAPTVLFTRHWIAGDVTLPCDPIANPPIGTSTATSVRIITE
jgi:hypothetical protein